MLCIEILKAYNSLWIPIFSDHTQNTLFVFNLVILILIVLVCLEQILSESPSIPTHVCMSLFCLSLLRRGFHRDLQYKCKETGQYSKKVGPKWVCHKAWMKWSTGIQLGFLFMFGQFEFKGEVKTKEKLNFYYLIFDFLLRIFLG